MIYRAIRFDDRQTRESRFELSQDKFEPIREIFDAVNVSFLQNYTPGTHITVDERMVGFRGRCGFRVYMKSKPDRYGMKLWVASDVETSYLLNIQPYLGKVGPFPEIGQGERVVKDLIAPFYGSNRGVTTDNFFTTVPLANFLLQQNITLTGTMRKNNRYIPEKMLNLKDRTEKSSIFYFSGDLTLVSYVPKKNKNVILLSSEFHDTSLEIGDKKRPELVIHYNVTKGGVDNGDRMTKLYTCSRTTRRWPLRMFMDLVDIAALNAYIIWTSKYPNWKINDRSRRQLFIRELGVELIRSNVILRQSVISNHHYHITYSFELFNKLVGIPQPSVSSCDDVTNKARCFFCMRNKDRKSKIKCEKCFKSICTKHQFQKKYVYCPNCFNDITF